MLLYFKSGDLASLGDSFECGRIYFERHVAVQKSQRSPYSILKRSNILIHNANGRKSGSIRKPTKRHPPGSGSGGARTTGCTLLEPHSGHRISGARAITFRLRLRAIGASFVAIVCSDGSAPESQASKTGAIKITTSTFPIRIVWPLARWASFTRLPLMKLPLVESRSRRSTVSPVTIISQ